MSQVRQEVGDSQADHETADPEVSVPGAVLASRVPRPSPDADVTESKPVLIGLYWNVPGSARGRRLPSLLPETRYQVIPSTRSSPRLQTSPTSWMSCNSITSPRRKSSLRSMVVISRLQSLYTFLRLHFVLTF